MKDGNHYFEAVEYCCTVDQEIPENRVALCPTCAAKWQHAKDETADLAATILSASSPEVEVTLARRPAKLKFVEEHFLDLKVVLEAALAETAETVVADI